MNGWFNTIDKEIAFIITLIFGYFFGKVIELMIKLSKKERGGKNK